MSEADRCSIFLGLAAWYFSFFFFFFFSQFWGHFLWFREPPNPTKTVRFGLVLVIWEADLVSPNCNKISYNKPTHETQSVGSFPISPVSHQCEGTHWDSVYVDPEIRRTYVFRVEFQILVFLSSKNLQPSSSTNLKNRAHNLWGSLQRKLSFVFLNNLADIRVASLLPLLHLAVCKEKDLKKKKGTKTNPWVNELEKSFWWHIYRKQFSFLLRLELVFVLFFNWIQHGVLSLLISGMNPFTSYWTLLAMDFHQQLCLLQFKL